jgi:predicted negative regulator of RcsB-dependent stress response
MNRKLEFTKALRLLDANRNDEALALLNTIQEQSREENDPVYFVRSGVVLGEYYFQNGNLAEAKKLLEMVTGTEVDEDQADILDFEINQAKELLGSIS